MNYQLGKLPPKIDKRTLKFGSYLTPLLPQFPDVIDIYKKVIQWPIFGNDRYGNCTCASVGHTILDRTTATNKIFLPTEKQILDAYKKVNGGKDAGAVMLDVLNLWRQNGVANHKIEAFAQLKPGSIDQLKHAIHLFGAAYIGLALPNYVMKNPLQISWNRTLQRPNSHNGHCVSVVGYDTKYIYVVTWGSIKAMSYNFYKKYTDEAYTTFSSDWIDALGKSPLGFNISTLNADLNEIIKDK